MAVTFYICKVGVTVLALRSDQSACLPRFKQSRQPISFRRRKGTVTRQRCFIYQLPAIVMMSAKFVSSTYAHASKAKAAPGHLQASWKLGCSSARTVGGVASAKKVKSDAVTAPRAPKLEVRATKLVPTTTVSKTQAGMKKAHGQPESNQVCNKPVVSKPASRIPSPTFSSGKKLSVKVADHCKQPAAPARIASCDQELKPSAAVRLPEEKQTGSVDPYVFPLAPPSAERPLVPGSYRHAMAMLYESGDLLPDLVLPPDEFDDVVLGAAATGAAEEEEEAAAAVRGQRFTITAPTSLGLLSARDVEEIMAGGGLLDEADVREIMGEEAAAALFPVLDYHFPDYPLVLMGPDDDPNDGLLSKQDVCEILGEEAAAALFPPLTIADHPLVLLTAEEEAGSSGEGLLDAADVLSMHGLLAALRLWPRRDEVVDAYEQSRAAPRPSAAAAATTPSRLKPPSPSTASNVASPAQRYRESCRRALLYSVRC